MHAASYITKDRGLESEFDLPERNVQLGRNTLSRAGLAVLACVSITGVAHPQVIEGRLTDAADGTPLSSTYVVLADDSNGEVARSVTNTDGIFRLPVDLDGRYFLRVELIGFNAAPSPEFTATANGSTRADYAVDLEPVRLEAAADRGQGCELPSRGMVASAWSETTKALRAVQETVRRGRLSFRTRLFQQTSQREGLIVRETDSILKVVGGAPFVKYSPEAISRRSGYVLDLTDGTRAYAMPEPVAFTSGDFDANHCFWLADGPTNGTVALRFQPQDSALVGALAGAFTLDEHTARLRHVEFRFAHDPTLDEDATPVALMHITQVNRADWFIDSWKLRTPIVRALPDSSSRAVLGFDDTGAHVLEATDPNGNQKWSAGAITVLYGTVFDSIENAPVQGGVVAVSGTEYWTQTDANGDFALAGYWDGSYGIIFGHPRLDSLGFISQPRVVSLRRGSETAVSLAVPPLATVLLQRCPTSLPVTGRKMLVGVVQDEDTKRPVSGALVSISRDLVPEEFRVFADERSSVIALTDSLGMYTVCDVPIGVTLSIAAMTGDKQSSFVRATFWEDAVTYGTGKPQPLRYPVGRLDLAVRSPDAYTAAVAGTVTDELTGVVMPGVNVTVEGTSQSANTDSAGVFVLQNLPDGPVRLTLRRLGYRMLRYTVETETADRVVLGPGALSMVQADADAVELDPITVEAEGVTPKLADFEERRSRGFGAFATKTDFEKWNPTTATDILRRLRGVRVRPNPFYGVNGDTRRNVIEPSRDIGQRVTQVVTASRTRGLVGGSGGQDITIQECPMLLFLDGVYLGDSYGTDVDNIVSTTDLSAVEVYSPSQVPVQFSMPGATCGVIVFWSY